VIPAIYDEYETLDLAKSFSIARFGDGELKLALGHNCISQSADPALAKELREILAGAPDSRCIVCLPNYYRNAKKQAWDDYSQPKYSTLFTRGPYGSAFITRPDSAPAIDTPEYWEQVRGLWSGKDVIFVRGGEKAAERSLRLANFGAARTVVDIQASTHRDAYNEVDELQARILSAASKVDNPLVIMCLGATATVLAWRLSRLGVQALDLGHIGMFMRHAGSYRYTIEDLASTSYRAMCAKMHQGRWGADGAKHLEPTLAYADELKAETVLDYGCGEAKLSEAAKSVRRILNFDPGVPGRDGMPKPIDMLVCTDVLEHVEPDKLDNVLAHQYRLTARGAYYVISTKPAKAILPDGRNAHLIIEDAAWWADKLAAQGWTIWRLDRHGEKEVCIWVRK